MSSKSNTAYKVSVPKNVRSHSGNRKEPSSTAERTQSGFKISPEGELGNCKTCIKVSYKSKKKKHTSTIVNNNSGQKVGKDNRKTIISKESCQNWGRVLQQQNQPIIKQSLQHYPLRSRSANSTKFVPESKDPSKKYLDENSSKQSCVRTKSEDGIKSTQHIPLNTSSAYSKESILIDKEIQYNLINLIDKKFINDNPIHKLAFFIKELGNIVKDKQSNKILNDMEQALHLIFMESNKLSAEDIHCIPYQKELEASTARLEEVSREMDEKCKSLRSERDLLRCQNDKQSLLLKKANQRQIEQENIIKIQEEQLNEVKNVIRNKGKIISELKEEKAKSIESLEKLIMDLRTNLSEQTNLARQASLEIQNLILERDRLSVLCNYKDTQLIKLDNIAKEYRELENQTAQQLTGLVRTCIQEEPSKPQVSITRDIPVSSSTLTSSEHSNIPRSWGEISDSIISSIGHDISNEHSNTEKKCITDINESNTNGSVQLEFISLPGGESSHTILDSCKDVGCMGESQLVVNNKEDKPEFKDIDTKSLLRSSTKKNKKLFTKDSKNQKSLRSNSKQYINEMNVKAVLDESSSNMNDESLSDHTRCNIEKQFQNMFNVARLKSRISVNVPSPPRDYPHPHWTDSSLLSMSATTDS